MEFLAIPIKEVNRIYRKAGEPVPTVKRPFESEDEWVNLAELKRRTGKTTDQARYIRAQHQDVIKVREGKAIGKDCYLYNITEIVKKAL